MTQEQVQELIQYLLQAAPWVWSAARREVFYEMVRLDIWTVSFVIFAAAAFRFSKRFLKEADEELAFFSPL